MHRVAVRHCRRCLHRYAVLFVGVASFPRVAHNPSDWLTHGYQDVHPSDVGVITPLHLTPNPSPKGEGGQGGTVAHEGVIRNIKGSALENATAALPSPSGEGPGVKCKAFR
jgi:hypothetical protein